MGGGRRGKRGRRRRRSGDIQGMCPHTLEASSCTYGGAMVTITKCISMGQQMEHWVIRGTGY